MALHGLLIIATTLAAVLAESAFPSYVLAGAFMNQENKRLIDVADAGVAGHPVPPPGMGGEGAICRTRTEACGFYTYNHRTGRPLKWISSWCSCGEGEECVFGGRSRKAYKHVCLPIVEEGQIRNGQQLIRLH